MTCVFIYTFLRSGTNYINNPIPPPRTDNTTSPKTLPYSCLLARESTLPVAEPAAELVVADSTRVDRVPTPPVVPDPEIPLAAVPGGNCTVLPTVKGPLIIVVLAAVVFCLARKDSVFVGTGPHAPDTTSRLSRQRFAGSYLSR
jgi:hypothetical protein